MAFKFHTSPKAKAISYYSTKRPVGNILYIVIHATGNMNDTAKGNANFFATSNKVMAGAHFFVDDNDVYQSISPFYTAKSVGATKKWKNCDNVGGGKLWHRCTNANSVSIELCSKNGKPTEKTLENAVALTLDLMKKYHVTSNRVIRHFDVTGKPCPYWDGWSINGETWKKGDSIATPEWFKFKKRILDDGKV